MAMGGALQRGVVLVFRPARLLAIIRCPQTRRSASPALLPQKSGHDAPPAAIRVSAVHPQSRPEPGGELRRKTGLRRYFSRFPSPDGNGAHHWRHVPGDLTT